MKFMAEQFLKATGAKVLNEGLKNSCAGISTDSRTVQKGELFFALTGPNFDGHAFCPAAIQKGAWGIVAEKVPSTEYRVPSTSWVFQVPNTLTALGNLSHWWRSQFNIPCAAITGSNGKTTTKEMTSAILSKKWRVLKTEGNFNNLIGLPLTLNRLNKEHQALVLEMGMNARGEIKRLTQIAQPNAGLVTNVAPAHLEKLQTVEAVARAKNELYETMSSQGTAIYNDEDPWMKKLVKNFSGKKIAFGMKSGLDVSFEHMESAGFDSMELKLAIRGKSLKAKLKTAGIHNVMNAMAACGIALSFEIPMESLWEGLENFVPLKMRFEQIQLQNGVRLINDAYNANPLSMEQAFQTVRGQPRRGEFIAVLGDMKELGEASAVLHEALGKKAVRNGVGRMFLIGAFSKEVAKGAKAQGLKASQIQIASNVEELSEKVSKTIQSGDVVLVKASRAMRLERVVEELKERFGI